MIGKVCTHGNISEEKQRMAKTLYKAKFTDKLPLGGIATGHIDFGHDGTVSGDFSPCFAIKAEKDGKLYDARLLQSSACESISLPCFENSSAFSFFPFAECHLSDLSFPAKVKVTAFSPFIPLNDKDSGIPGVLFSFEVTNTSDEKLEYSICGMANNTNISPFNRMGCTDTGEAYIHLSADEENPYNVCIATNSKNVSFCEYISGAKDFVSNFTGNTTLYNKTKSECENHAPSGALCTHFSLESGESTEVYFCLSWYCPENEFSRNYYAQYFESSLECASYLFRQKDRLHTSSMGFCENVMGATLPENVIEEANRDLFTFLSKDFLRLDDGTLVSSEKEVFRTFEEFLSRSGIMASMFPEAEHSKTADFYKNALYETAKDEDIILSVLRTYRKYILGGDTDALIEEWYYITKCMEKLFGEDGKEKCKADKLLITAVIDAAVCMSDAVRDKKRNELYSSMLCDFPIEQFAMDIVSGFARINEISGFEYNAVNKHIGFNPQSDFCPLDDGGTFRCFFCTPQGYGYVEEGIDYIEINLLKGSLSIRSFGVPRTPRLVQYGGRNWRFENKNLVAVLDSDLEITPYKKLTIFIDIKQ